MTVCHYAEYIVLICDNYPTMPICIISLNMLVCILYYLPDYVRHVSFPDYACTYIVVFAQLFKTFPDFDILYYLPDYVRHVSFPNYARMYIVSFARLYLYDMYHFPTMLVCILYYLPDYTCMTCIISQLCLYVYCIIYPMTCIILLNVIVYYFSEYYVLCVIYPTMPVCIISPTMLVCIHYFSF